MEKEEGSPRGINLTGRSSASQQPPPSAEQTLNSTTISGDASPFPFLPGQNLCVWEAEISRTPPPLKIPRFGLLAPYTNLSLRG